MKKKQFRQKYFVSKDLRISIALMILWALLVTAFFTHFTKELSGRIGHGTLLFIIIMIGYVVIVIVLTMLFSHRLLGPFQRLNTEIRLIIAGECHRRLIIRKNDDLYIRSFVSEVNKLLDEYEKICHYKEDIVKHIDSELLDMISSIEDGETSKVKLREAILEFRKKIKNLT